MPELDRVLSHIIMKSVEALIDKMVIRSTLN